eukprot:UN01765
MNIKRVENENAVTSQVFKIDSVPLPSKILIYRQTFKWNDKRLENSLNSDDALVLEHWPLARMSELKNHRNCPRWLTFYGKFEHAKEGWAEVVSETQIEPLKHVAYKIVER